MSNSLEMVQVSDFSDNSLDMKLSEFQGRDSRGVERNIVTYLKSLGLRMKTNPSNKQLSYEKNNLKIIQILIGSGQMHPKSVEELSNIQILEKNTISKNAFFQRRNISKLHL